MNNELYDGKKSVVILLTGGIGSGKSAVRQILEGMGVPCYDADSAVKGFYAVPAGADEPSSESGTLLRNSVSEPESFLGTSRRPFLLPDIEAALGQKFRRADGGFDRRALAAVIFSDAAKLKTVEDIVFPALAADFERWRNAVTGRDLETASGQNASAAMGGVAEGRSPEDVVVFESATALDKPGFPKIWDKCLWVDAPEEMRIERVIARDRCTREQVLSRLRLQSPLEAHRGEIDAIILNDCTLPELSSRVRSALNCIMRPVNRCR